MNIYTKNILTKNCSKFRFNLQTLITKSNLFDIRSKIQLLKTNMLFKGEEPVMESSIKEIAETILNEQSTYSEIKDSIDKLAGNFYQVTNLAGKIKKAEHGTILPDGEALTPQTAAGCIFDYVRTTKFLRGIKNAIDFQLNTLGKKKVKIMYVGTGPHATLLFPLIPLYDETQLEISLIDYHQESIDSLNLLISHYGFNNYFDEILCGDATNYEHKKEYLYDIIIIETMQKALVCGTSGSHYKSFFSVLSKGWISNT